MRGMRGSSSRRRAAPLRLGLPIGMTCLPLRLEASSEGRFLFLILRFLRGRAKRDGPAEALGAG